MGFFLSIPLPRSLGGRAPVHPSAVRVHMPPAVTQQSGESLVSAGELRQYLRIEHTDDSELIDQLCEEAEALAEGYLRRPIQSRLITVVDRAERNRVWDTAPTSLVIGTSPVSGTADDVAIVDRDGNTVDPAIYLVGESDGLVYAKQGHNFPAGPYTITAAVGLQYRSDWDPVVLGACRRAITDIAADLYQQRNPSATTEAQGGGISVTYGESVDGIPKRAAGQLNSYRLVTT